MSSKPRSDDFCRQVIAALDKADGVFAQGARLLGIPEMTFRHACRDAIKRGFKPKEKPVPEMDPIDTHRDRTRATVLTKRVKELESLAADDRTIREAVFGLKAQPITPPSWKPRPQRGGHQREAIITFLSDLHMGETVSLTQMGGRNSYNMKIAQDRVERYFQNVVKLGTEHWSGPPPDALYLVLGGDLITGEIHEELAKTNELQSIPAVKAAVEAIAAGLMLLRTSFPNITIHVISVPGNHGRTTKKPESKGFAINSYDTLVALMLEFWATTAGLKNVTFSAPQTGDAYVTIHGWNFLFTHGDRIGSRGGSGFVGPAATAARGMQKLVQDYLTEGRVIDVIVMGHFHTPLELEHGFVNSSVIGPNEYSRTGRMRSHPAAQWMLTVHPQYGVARRWKIQIGHPSEGSIYNGRIA